VNDFLGQLNLTPSERRIVVVIFLVVIVVLNLLFVWPRFSDWGRMTKQLEQMRQTEANYISTIQLDVSPTNGWRKEVEKMARLEGGSKIDTPVDPQNQMQQTIIQEERKTGVTVGSFSPGPVKTNAFFEEHSTAISFESQEPQLVDFLYKMGNDPAMIRVAKLDLKATEPNRYTLKGTITFTGNYAKQSATTTAAPLAKHVFEPKPAAGNRLQGSPTAAQNARHTPGGPPAPGAYKLPPGRKGNPLSKLVPPAKPGLDQRNPQKNER
jgi:Tfp pilus assembly protein PilO